MERQDRLQLYPETSADSLSGSHTGWGVCACVTRRLGGLKGNNNGLLCAECDFSGWSLNLKATSCHTSSKMEI